LILAVNTRDAPNEDAGVVASPATFTVAVTTAQAEKIAAAKERGPLTVVLRRPGE
jgi:Flp pilus assembly protein CpaB